MASAGHGLVPSGKADDIRLVIDAIPGLVKPAREDGSTKFSHQRRIESSWFSFKQGLNRGRKDATNPDDFPRIVWTFQKTLTFGPPFDVERRFLRSNGEAQLGNEIAIKTCHEWYFPLRRISIIVSTNVALHCNRVPPDEGDKIVGCVQAYVARSAAVNTQAVVKDSKKYAPTGVWGFGDSKDRKPAHQAVLKICFHCHEPVKDRASSIPVTHLKAEKYARLQSQKVDKLIRRKEHGKPKECNPG